MLQASTDMIKVNIFIVCNFHNMQLVFIEIEYHNACDTHERSQTVLIVVVKVSSSCISKKQMLLEYVLDLSVTSCACLDS